MAKGPGRGKLPALENLLKKTPEQLVSTLERFGVDPDVDGLASRSERSWMRLERLAREGIEPDEAMWEQLDKSAERDMTQNLRKMTKSAIRTYRQSKLPNDKLMWLTVGDEKVCKSCEPRHGKVKTRKQWQASGMPGSANLVCTDECRCQLIPSP